MPLVIHLLVKNAVDPNGAVSLVFVKDDVMSNFMAPEPWSDDIVLYFKKGRQVVQPLNGGIDLPVVDNRLIFRPGFNGVVPDAIQIRNGFSG